jgi:hypothetical protein
MIAVYTFLLPEVILVYRAIEARFGQETAGKIPLVVVILAGLGYALALLLSHRSLGNIFFLLPCAMIAVMIIGLEPNPNKHIHIPEYILLAWLLYAVLSKDYRGAGLLVLVFVCAAMLGVVDELEQGIHPKRFYGWTDMLVNSSSALIGVFTIMGLRTIPVGDWAWTASLRRHRALIALGLFGLAGIILTCILLFRVQAMEKTYGIYPAWLTIWNVLFLLSAPLVANFAASAHTRTPAGEAEAATTSRLWLVPILVILLYMHALAAYIAGSGIEFR